MRNPISLVAALFLSVLVSALCMSRPFQGVLNWDVTGYYFYLPATFIYGDPALEDPSWMEELRVRYDLSGTLYQFHPVEGRSAHVDQYTSGMAVLYAPAFAAAHALAPLTGHRRDGFSPVYQDAIAIWSILVALAGIWVFRRALLLFFGDGLTAILLVLVLTGTNYLIQVPRGLATPHNYLFLFYGWLLWSVVRWHRTASRSAWWEMAIALGIMCLVRPTEIIAGLLPLCWGCRSPREVVRKVRTWCKVSPGHVWGWVAVFLSFASPQVCYWLVTTGQPLYMSYANPGEGLDLLSPHTFSFLFSFRKGWFIYTPLAGVALAGLWYTRRRFPEFFLPLAAFLLVNLYVASSWSTWWYAQCFSQRAMVQSLPVLAIPLGHLLGALPARSGRSAFTRGAVGLLWGLTVFHQWQYEHGILHPDRMTRGYFMRVFGRTSVSDGAREHLLVERSFDGTMEFRDRLKYRAADSLSLCGAHPSACADSIGYFVLSATQAFTPAIRKPFREWTGSDHAWLTVEADILPPASAHPDDCLLVATADHGGGVYGYRAEGVTPESWKPGEWNTIRLDYLTPEVRRPQDPISVYLWYRGGDSVAVRDIRVTTWERMPPR